MNFHFGTKAKPVSDSKRLSLCSLCLLSKGKVDGPPETENNFFSFLEELDHSTHFLKNVEIAGNCGKEIINQMLRV